MMPEPDGNTLPSEQPRFNLQGLGGRKLLANELLDIGLKGLNRGGRMPYALETHVFTVANKDYDQAVEAFRYGLYEASMVMVRATIDAALYASKYTIVDKISGFDMDMGGGLSSHHDRWGTKKVSEDERKKYDQSREQYIEFKPLGITVKKVAQSKLGQWKDLSEEARELGFTSKRIKQMEKIRDRYGNLSAHNAARQMSDLFEYAGLSEEQRKGVKPPKWFINEREAYQVLKQTAKFLVYIRRTYAIRTLKSLNWTTKKVIT